MRVEIKGKRLGVMILALVVTVALLTFGKTVYQENFIAKPLAEVLKNNKDVKQIQVLTTKKQLEVVVELDWTEQLPQIHTALERQVEAQLGDKSYELILKDSRGEELVPIFNGINIYLQEAMSRGNFAEMDGAIKTYMNEQSGVSYQMNVDMKYVYVSLKKGEHFLYEILPRSGR